MVPTQQSQRINPPWDDLPKSPAEEEIWIPNPVRRTHFCKDTIDSRTCMSSGVLGQ